MTNAGTGVIIGGTGIYSGTGAVTVSNAGLVQGTSGSAMSLTLGNAAGYVRNTGTVAGKSDGIYAAGGLVTIWNSGAITATQTAGCRAAGRRVGDQCVGRGDRRPVGGDGDRAGDLRRYDRDGDQPERGHDQRDEIRVADRLNPGVG